MRPLLLTFDAFNTLFHPRRTIPTQYRASASNFGIHVSYLHLREAFKAAFKAQSLSHPNYGRDLALRGKYAGPQQWWEDVIRASFAGAFERDDDKRNTTTEIPAALIHDLLDRFASIRGYKLCRGVAPFFKHLRSIQRDGGGLEARRKIVIGVVSNSDDRICSVLQSLGVSVGEARAGETESHKLPGFEEERERISPLQHQKDVDFVLTSYQLGVEKPDPLVWDVALRTAQSLRPGAGDNEGWECVHVGDEYARDYHGAVNAGWKAYYLSQQAEAPANVPEGTKTIKSLLDLIPELEALKQIK
ncbi:HAD-like domain-containing protein [Aspergillus lucknowensis]|uniref:HAD-like domain-containing protein n=1 Tax=Aspergillus lucknowensis TaxID=176173 RepID=A0ABR4LVR8_9EURO